MRIIIAGAGIGGLATALSLEAAGFRDIRIFEAVSHLRPLGVGINLQPHAVRELTELGLGERLSAQGVPISSLSYYNRHGQQIWLEPRGLDADYRWPQYAVHRGHFQLLLRDAVDERLPGVVEYGASVSDYRDEGPDAPAAGSVLVTTRDGSRREHADLVIAADGIHSAIRKQFHPDEGDPIWNGLILWRGTAETSPYLDGRSMIMAGDHLQKFVAYPLREATDDRPALVNFIAEYRSDGAQPGVTDWNRTADPARVLDMFRSWRWDWLDCPSIIEASNELLEYPMSDRDPLDSWTLGRRLTLLGDAAHAMYPIGSNGASQAILDARVLARELATQPSIEGALEAYDAQRRPATTAVIRSNRQMGPEIVMKMAYERAPEGFDDIDAIIPHAERAEIAGRYKQAAGMDPALLNDRETYSVERRDIP